MNREEATTLATTTLDELAHALEQGRSEKLVSYLDMLSRFHQYSFRNCMLIATQKPEATFVAGFRRWKAIGRHVKKGEKGIAILAPLVYRSKSDGDERPNETETDSKVRTLCGFKVVHVFDVSQTEGEELPEFSEISGDPGDEIERLEAVIASHGIELQYASIPGGALGSSAGGKITVLPHLEPALRFSVLAHELGHERLGHAERRKETTRTIRETEAEAVAFVVCRAAGLDVGTQSSDYIQLYSGDQDVLSESLSHIQKTATFILTELETATVREEVAHVA